MCCQMTDNEIIKALECFALDYDFSETQCIGCAFEHEFCTVNMSVEIARPALEIINRQKAEIERLSDLLKRHQRNTRRIRMINAETAKKIKDEAIEEFAEILKAKADDKLPCENSVDEVDIDNLVKEKVGDNNG